MSELMIEEDLCVGVVVRHKVQAGWGVGVVASVVSAHIDVVVDFDDAGLAFWNL